MKLNRLSRVGGGSAKRSNMDSVNHARTTTRDDRIRGLQLLMEAQNYYMAMAKFRRDRERCKRYVYGDQWSDIVCVDGVKMREDEWIARQGNIPLKNNLMRRLVRNVIGVYRSQSTEPTCIARDRDEQNLGETMSTLLQYNMQLNRMTEVYARTMEEFLISGMIVHRKHYGWRNNKMDCWTDYVQPNNFFIDTNMRDFRGWDCTCVGEIHDVDFDTLCSQFATSPADHARLAEIYSTASNCIALAQVWDSFGYSRGANEMDFLTPADQSRCRVIEIWRKEAKPRYRCHDWNNGEIFKIDQKDYNEVVVAENNRRLRDGMSLGMTEDEIPLIEAEWMIDSYWYYYYLSPQGDILAEGETPYEHKSHPYVFKAYPFIDGEIHSFSNDVIDQQRYTNRLITLYDWIMRASAKGVLMIPEDCIPVGMSPQDFADTWSKFNGVLVFKPSTKHQSIPHQIANNSTNIGISELLNVQLKFFEDISGVNGALQGKPGYSGMSASLYNQQTQNSTMSLLDILDSFSEFTLEAAYKDVKNIQQYYDEKRILNIAGRKSINSVLPDPEKVRDVEFDLSIVPSTATPAYRALANDFLMQIWSAGQISLQQLLETGNFPFADRLLQSIQSQQAQMAQGQTPEGIPADVAAQAQEGANMEAVNKLHKAMRA
ncbi:MAG: hypothetical protein K2H98_00100 [Duncaniella sp.]|nr:hypothetical protein [Duncaniella sp.]